MFKELKSFFTGPRSKGSCASGTPSRKELKCAEKDQMTQQSEKQIDKTNEQSFPASDPPTNY